MTELREKIAIELAYCRHIDASVTETARRIEALITRKHLYWRAGEPDCPGEIKAGNGELWKLRCKVCGQDNPRSDICLGASHDD